MILKLLKKKIKLKKGIKLKNIKNNNYLYDNYLPLDKIEVMEHLYIDDDTDEKEIKDFYLKLSFNRTLDKNNSKENDLEITLKDIIQKKIELYRKKIDEEEEKIETILSDLDL